MTRSRVGGRTPDVMATLGARSNLIRHDRSLMRSELARGSTPLSRVVCERQAWAFDVQLFDLLLWQRGFGPEKLRELNRRAVAAGINLAQCLGRAGARTRAWLVSELEASGR